MPPNHWCFNLIEIILFLVPVKTAFSSCRNETGHPVDWFVLYKLPRYQINKTSGSGLDYLYLDPTTGGWYPIKNLINTTQSALGQTLQHLYEAYKSQENTTAYMMYNDAPVNKAYNKRYGHTKGVLFLDKVQGFWLMHSVPYFPPGPETGYIYPNTGRKNGQIAICITYKYNQFIEIGTQLLHYNPNAYSCLVPEGFLPDLVNLHKICTGAPLPKTQRTRLIKLKSSQGEYFLNFAKSYNFVDDIYTGWTAQALNSSLLVQTWRQVPNELPSNCTLPRHVYNVERVKLAGPFLFSSIYDHSKWCVSLRYSDQWTCIGDLNRDPRQFYKSGGLICTQNKDIYQAIRPSVSWFEACNDC